MRSPLAIRNLQMLGKSGLIICLSRDKVRENVGHYISSKRPSLGGVRLSIVNWRLFHPYHTLNEFLHAKTWSRNTPTFSKFNPPPCRGYQACDAVSQLDVPLFRGPIELNPYLQQSFSRTKGRNLLFLFFENTFSFNTRFKGIKTRTPSRIEKLLIKS